MTPTLLLLAMMAGDPPATTVQADDPKTIRMRIEQAMKAIEQKLRTEKVDDETKSLQVDLLGEIDKLLNLKNPPTTPPPGAVPPPPSPPTNGKGDSTDEKNDSANDPTGGSGSKTNTQSNNAPRPGSGSGKRERMDGERPATNSAKGGSESRRERRAQANKSTEQAKNSSPGRPGERGEPQPGSPGDRPGEADGNPGTNPDQATGARMTPIQPGRTEKLSDVSRDVWGHLPESLRQEVDHYYKERFMPRYKELLQQYYNRLAEADRKSGDKK